MWLFEKIDDLSLDQPLTKKQKVSQQIAVSNENIEMVVAMGFTTNQAKHALRKSVKDI